MATYSSILAWKITWTEKPGRLRFTGPQRVRHDWATEHMWTHTLTKQLIRQRLSLQKHSSQQMNRNDGINISPLCALMNLDTEHKQLVTSSRKRETTSHFVPPDRRQGHRWSSLNKQVKHGWPSFLIQVPIYTVHRGDRYIYCLYRYYTEDKQTWSRKPRGLSQPNPDLGKLEDKQPGLFNTSDNIVRRKEGRKERMEKELQTETHYTKDTSANHKMWILCGSQFRWTVKRQQQNLWHLGNNWKFGHWLDAGSYRTILTFILNKTTGLLFFKDFMYLYTLKIHTMEKMTCLRLLQSNTRLLGLHLS